MNCITCGTENVSCFIRINGKLLKYCFTCYTSIPEHIPQEQYYNYAILKRKVKDATLQQRL